MNSQGFRVRTSTAMASAVFALFAGLIAFGCAGSEAATENLAPRMRTSSLSGFQSMAGISGYIQRGMQASSPIAITAMATDENGFDNMLGLYVGDPTFSGNTMTIPFFSDALHAVPAGHMTLSMAGDTWDQNYETFPTTIAGHIDVDSGHHAGSGNFTVTFLNALGDCNIDGEFHLDQNDIDVTLDLGVTNNGTQISGGWTAAANGVTVRVTNLSGNVNGDWAGNIRIDPFGWTGTIVMNPQTGLYAATINSSQGPFTIGVNSAMTMTINHGSTNIVIPNALAAGLNPEPGGGGNGSGGNTGGLTATGGGTIGGETGGETNGGETNGGETNGGTTGETNGGTTGETTTGSTIGTTSAGTTSAGTTGETNGSTTAGTTTAGTTGSTTTTTTGETNGSTSAGTTSSGTTGSTTTTGETNGSTSAGTTSSGTTGSTTTTGETGSTNGSTSAGTTSSGTTGSTSTTGESGSTGSTGGVTTGSSGSTTGTTGTSSTGTSGSSG